MAASKSFFIMLILILKLLQIQKSSFPPILTLMSLSGTETWAIEMDLRNVSSSFWMLGLNIWYLLPD